MINENIESPSKDEKTGNISRKNRETHGMVVYKRVG